MEKLIKTTCEHCGESQELVMHINIDKVQVTEEDPDRWIFDLLRNKEIS